VENKETVTIESGALPVENSCEVARLHDVLGNPERLLIIGSRGGDGGDTPQFCYTRYQTDRESFDDATFYDLPTIGLFADLIVEFCHEYNASPLCCLSCIEQLVMEQELLQES